MDYFQGVVVEYLRANRQTFVNTECCIQLNEGNPDTSGPHWYCDAIAVNIAAKRVWLCEVSYAKGLSALSHRLHAWSEHWDGIRRALNRDCGIPLDWHVVPRAFIPAVRRDDFSGIAQKLAARPATMPKPEVTYLEEEVLPWQYSGYNRTEKHE